MKVFNSKKIPAVNESRSPNLNFTAVHNRAEGRAVLELLSRSLPPPLERYGLDLSRLGPVAVCLPPGADTFLTPQVLQDFDRYEKECLDNFLIARSRSLIPFTYPHFHHPSRVVIDTFCKKEKKAIGKEFPLQASNFGSTNTKDGKSDRFIYPQQHPRDKIVESRLCNPSRASSTFTHYHHPKQDKNKRIISSGGGIIGHTLRPWISNGPTAAANCRKSHSTATSRVSTSTLVSSSPKDFNHTYVTRVQGSGGGVCSAWPVRMKGKRSQNVPDAAPSSEPQTPSGATHPSTPRTPAPSSDSGTHTPNPPTPNSNSMTNNSPQQFVAITVEASPPDGSTNGVNANSENSYVPYVEGTATDHSSALYSPPATTTVAANGQTISYPVYTTVDGESGIVYASGNNNSPHFFPNGSSTNGVAYAQDGSVFLVQSSTSNNNNSLLDGVGGTISNITTNRVPTVTRKKKSVPELCPIPATHVSSPTQRHRSGSSNSQHHQQMQEDYSNHEEGENIYMDDVNTASYANATNPPALVPEMDNFRYAVHGSDNSDIDSFLEHTSEGSLMYAGVSSAASIRTNPLTVTTQRDYSQMVQWLLENYETAEGVSLPRYTLYNHYLRHCSEHQLDPVNAASFGKLIRGVFLGLRTRRLGTRGNSKYHYYGIRLKPESPLNMVKDEYFPMNGSFSSNGHHNSSANAHRGNHQGGIGGGNPNKRFKPTSRNDLGDNSNGFVMVDANEYKEYLGHYEDSIGDPFQIPDLHPGEEGYPSGINESDLMTFRELYVGQYCKAQLTAIKAFHLGNFELNCNRLWRSDDLDGGQFDNLLTKSKVASICKMKVVEEFIRIVDYRLYQLVLEILLPDVLRPIPSGMTQAIRNFAKVVEGWVTLAMVGYPDSITAIKISTVNALAQTLRRYTSLNHLAQAARAVLQNQNQITQMLADLNRVDFRNVEEQASWVCGCMGNIVPSLEKDFKDTLSQQQSLDQWAEWLEKVVDKLVKPYEGSPDFLNTARNFLLKWSFYSSLIIRDLTLRSAASFGSFHLLRLLYDEYIFYIVEHRVATATGVVPIQVIGNGRNAPSGLNISGNSVNSQSVVSDNDKPCKSNGNSSRHESSSTPPNEQTQTNGAVAVKTEVNNGRW